MQDRSTKDTENCRRIVMIVDMVLAGTSVQELLRVMPGAAR